MLTTLWLIFLHIRKARLLPTGAIREDLLLSIIPEFHQRGMIRVVVFFDLFRRSYAARPRGVRRGSIALPLLCCRFRRRIANLGVREFPQRLLVSWVCSQGYQWKRKMCLYFFAESALQKFTTRNQSQVSGSHSTMFWALVSRIFYLLSEWSSQTAIFL